MFTKIRISIASATKKNTPLRDPKSAGAVAVIRHAR